MKSLNPPAPQDLATLVKGGSARRLKLTWPVIILLAVAAGVAWYWWNQRSEAQNQLPPYITEAVQRGDLSLSITATGNLEPTNEVTVGSELSGIVLEVLVDTNDHVTKGQPLAKLDTSKLAQQTESSRANLNASQAQVAQAEATLKESKAALARLQELSRLSGGKAVSKADMDTAMATADRSEAELLSARASVGQAKAQLLINESDLEKAIIKSPIDGIVLTRSVEPGQTVAASFTAPELFIIAEKLEHMKLKVAVAEADIGRVANGQKSTFTVDAWPNRSYTANVTKVSFGSAVTDNVVTYETELEVTNDDLSLRPGMTATADIRVAEARGVLLVPSSALRFDPAKAIASAAPPSGASSQKPSFVQSIMPGPRRFSSGSHRPTDGAAAEKSTPGIARIWVLRDGTPEPITVKLGLSDGRHTEISGDGVTEGLQIITRANPPASS